MDYTVDMICDESRQKLRALSEKVTEMMHGCFVSTVRYVLSSFVFVF
ncbi:hypothetical protein AXX17_AT4G15440 [Arabidopsis thaliana]|uniref:Uncharacterized protein n=1 Tax=Arabidopsis thaliana TaxID=3702 RepID=A0A178V1W6_ARATH|nr:hypothetical protein AXX17_AT4G15440 [Arabidopsis thaliana]